MTDTIYSSTRATGLSTALYTTGAGRSQADTTHEEAFSFRQPDAGFQELFGEVRQDSMGGMRQDFANTADEDGQDGAETDTGSKVLDYLGRSAKQLVLGNYTEDVTLLGTAAQIGTGLLGVDLPGDIRDVVYDLTNWEWSWKHAGQTALDAVGMLPIIGVLKYGDEAGTLIKSGVKNVDEAAGLANKVQDAARDGLKQISESSITNDVILTRATKSGLASGTTGSAMDATKFQRIKIAFESKGGVIDQSADAQAYLKMRGAEGLTLNEKTILLPENASTSAVFEELIHSTQFRNGIATSSNVTEMEIQAAEKLIRNRKAYGIPNIETRQTIERLRQYRGQ